MDDFTRGGNKKQSWPRGLDYTSLLLLQQERKTEMGMKVPKTHTLFAWGFLSTNLFFGGDTILIFFVFGPRWELNGVLKEREI